MPSRRAIQRVLHNFLGSLTSRYSHFDGYWLFGFVVEGMQRISVDLLYAAPVVDSMPASPNSALQELAKRRFSEQLSRAGLSAGLVREAVLEISKPPVSRVGAVNGHLSAGHDIQFVARATTDLGRAYSAFVCHFVAPHNPHAEHRSG